MTKQKQPVRLLNPWGIALFILFTLIIIVPAINEYYASKKDLLNIWQNQGKLLSGTILRSGTKILAFDQEANDEQRAHLRDLGQYIRQLDSLNSGRKRSAAAGLEQKLGRQILFTDNKGNIVWPKNQRKRRGLNKRIGPSLKSLINFDTINQNITIVDGPERGPLRGILLIVKRARADGYIVLLPPPGGRQQKMSLQRLGSWLNHLSEMPGIAYILLEKDKKILAQSGKVQPPDAPKTRPLGPRNPRDRLIELDQLSLFEYTQSGPGGLIVRIGLSVEALDNLQESLVNRLIISSLLLLFSGFVLMIYLMKQQNYALLSSKFQQMQTYSGSILENMGEGIIVLDEDSRISIFNQAAADILEVDARTLDGQIITEAQLPLDTELLKKYAQFKQLDNFPLNLNTLQSGKHFVTSARHASYRENNNDNQFQHLYIILLRDISSQVELELIRRRRSKLLAMGQLAARVAHEIRNPLNGIGVLAQRLQKEFQPSKNDSEFKQMTGSIRQETGRINTIIETFLAYARTPQLNFATVDIRALISELMPILHSMGSVEVKYLPDDNCMAAIDRDQFTQVILNLVRNAVEVSESGQPVRLVLNCNSQHILLKIEDQGPGIADNLKDKIFDLYYTTKENGSGLGLSIVEKIISAHGGKVWFESPYFAGNTSVNGARFIVQIPAAADPNPVMKPNNLQAEF